MDEKIKVKTIDLVKVKIVPVKGEKGDTGDPGTLTDAQVKKIVNDYFAIHPTLVVPDNSVSTMKLVNGSVTKSKLSTELQNDLDNLIYTDDQGKFYVNVEE